MSKVPHRAKRAVILAVDLSLVLIGLYLAFGLRLDRFSPVERLGQDPLLFPLVALAAVVVLVILRIPWIKIGALEGRALLRIAFAAVVLGVSVMVMGFLFRFAIPRSVPLIFTVLFFAFAVLTRVAVLQLVAREQKRFAAADPVAIYGAGSAGIQLASALRQSSEMRPVLFLDDNPNLHGLMVAGMPVFAPQRLARLADRFGLVRVLLAMPSVEPRRLRQIADRLGAEQVEVQILPSYVELISRRGGANLRTVSPDELLGRTEVDLDVTDITRAYAGRVVMVTGAGGSIGSELCRQLLECRVAKMVLLEQSEFALYTISEELRPRAAQIGVQIVARLGSVTDRGRVDQVLAEQKVDTILHAAAYKHVPMVEENELEGARTNVLGTRTMALAALDAGVDRFVLISTDKAVRPSNVMGATKRLAELTIQDIAARRPKTRFSMVRFGNVLGSSGSVIPLFQRQIAEGGPVTVTDPEVTRYFMTIPEAAGLVLLAGSYSVGGDVFVLDMGAPVKIVDLARNMIGLSGREVYDPKTGLGDIRIEFTGLRPGEKLYEELLIANDSLRDTPHPRILRAEETRLSELEMKVALYEIEGAIAGRSPARLRRLIETRIGALRGPHHAPEPQQADVMVAPALPVLPRKIARRAAPGVARAPG